MVPIRTVRKKIGELLIERHVITAQQLDIAIEEQSKKGGYLSQHLIALGFAKELDIAMCLSNQYNFAYLPLKNYLIPEDVLETIPLKWIKIYNLLPVDKMNKVLSVAMVDPLNEGVIQMLHEITNCEIMVFISTYAEITEAINKYFSQDLSELEKHKISPKDLEKIRVMGQFIQTKPYSGQDRREYIRIKKELNIFFYYHDVVFHGKTKDVSYGGVSFISKDKGCGGVSFFSDIFMPLNSSIACKINLKPDRLPIDVVLKVLRVQAIKDDLSIDAKKQQAKKYEIAGMFEFITNEDREDLLDFLKANLA